jgi:hypothetical protein
MAWRGAFKDAFWTLHRRLGDRFHSIQIFTDDPAFPWELMVPHKRDGSEQLDFLGVEFQVARWHIGAAVNQRERPPQKLRVQELAVIGPRYPAERALPGQQKELAVCPAASCTSPVTAW